MFLGRFSSISKKYAQTFYEDSYFYLTPKQGLLKPDDIVLKRETTDTPSFNDPKAIDFEDLKKQRKEICLKERYDLIVFLGTKHLQKEGWTVSRFWEHEVRKNPEKILSKIIILLESKNAK